MPEYTIQIFNEKVVAEKFRRQAHAAGNARVAFRQIADLLMDTTDKRFEAQGPGWIPLTSKWAARKATHGQDIRILHQSGALRKSVTQPGAAGQILKIGPHSLEYGSKLSYAARHQYGFGQTPQRRYLFTTAADRRKIRQILRLHLMQAFISRPRALYVPRFTNLPRR